MSGSRTVVACLVLILGFASNVQTASGRNWPGQRDQPEALMEQQFYCNTGYTIEVCRAQLARLREVLATFDLRALQGWTWILVRSDDWKQILRRVGRDPDSPAFTVLEKRQIFLEEALFAPRVDRSQRFLEKWRLPLDQLLEFAVSHELGHALCRVADEARVIGYAEQLRLSRTVICDASR
jgi:hypothetical protein